MKRLMRSLAHLGIMVVIAGLLFWMMSPFFPNFDRLLLTDPTWGLLSVFGLFMMGVFIALELTSIIVINLISGPPFD